MHPPQRIALLSILLLLIAGCTDATNDAAPTDTLDADASNPDPTGQGGSIQGTVTDPEIQPVANVGVALAGTNRTALTDQDGAFRFDNLEPKRYSVTASAPGFQTGIKDAVVRTGETAKVQLVLEPVAIPEEEGEPVLDTREFEGLMSCSASTSVIRINPCQPICLDESVSGLLPHACTAGDPNDQSEIYFPVPEGIKSLILEVVMEPGLTGTTHMVLFTADCTEEQGLDQGCDSWDQQQGVSPLREEINETNDAEDLNYTGERTIRASLWADWNITPAAYVQHRFTLYVTTALLFEAPEGYTALNRDETE